MKHLPPEHRRSVASSGQENVEIFAFTVFRTQILLLIVFITRSVLINELFPHFAPSFSLTSQYTLLQLKLIYIHVKRVSHRAIPLLCWGGAL